MEPMLVLFKLLVGAARVGARGHFKVREVLFHHTVSPLANYTFDSLDLHALPSPSVAKVTCVGPRPYF